MKGRSLFIFIVLLACCTKENPTKPDTSPPKVEIETPVDSQQVWANVYIRVSATDESPIKHINLWGNSSLLRTSTTSPLEYTWDITPYPEGTILSIWASATDIHENTGYSDTITLFVHQHSTETINLTADTIGARFVTLRWTKYTGLYFNSYLVALATSENVDTFDLVVARLYSQADTSYTVSGLTPSTVYFFRVFVRKTNSELIASNEIRVETAREEIRDDGAVMVFVDGGSFIMGDSWGVGANDENPPHTVELPAFYIDKYEVTNRLFARFIDEGGYDNPEFWSTEGWQWKIRNNISQPLYWNTGQYMSGPDYPDYPVVGISYYEAEAYARFAGKELPTEAMWEKAARGIANTIGYKWPWGNEFHQNIDGVFVHCNYNGNDGFEDEFQTLAPVGSFPSGTSYYGAHDMAGNVAEWVSDWYAANYYQFSPSINPQGPNSGTEKVIRGGSWVNSSSTSLPGYSFRTSARSKKDPTDRKHYIGFRCVRIVR